MKILVMLLACLTTACSTVSTHTIDGDYMIMTRFQPGRIIHCYRMYNEQEPLRFTRCSTRYEYTCEKMSLDVFIGCELDTTEY